MKNYIKPGMRVTAIAPNGGVTSGQGMLIGALFGVSCNTAAEGEEFEMFVGHGVFALPKEAPLVIAKFAAVYWDNTAKKLTTTSANNYLVGALEDAAASADTTANVRLNGGTVAVTA